MEIQLANIYKSFNGNQVLTDVNLLLDSGKIMCLLGPSGSGKTTLIRILIGALRADSGKVRIGNDTMPNLNVTRRIGFMPQNDAVYPDLTGYDNLMFFGRMYHMKESELKIKAVNLLDMMNLSRDKDKLVSQYSGGMKKRLSLAIVLLHDPDILVLDEPTVGIDPVLRKVIWNEFHKLNEQGKTLLVSTHVMDEVKQCDYAALLYNGEIIEYDTVDSLLGKTSNGDIEELFLMSAKEN